MLVLTSGCLLKLSAANCIASLPFSALKITTTTALSLSTDVAIPHLILTLWITANGKNETYTIVETKMVEAVASGY